MKLNVTVLPTMLAVAISLTLLSCGESAPTTQNNSPDSTESRIDGGRSTEDPPSLTAEVTFHVDGLMKTESGAT